MIIDINRAHALLGMLFALVCIKWHFPVLTGKNLFLPVFTRTLPFSVKTGFCRQKANPGLLLWMKKNLDGIHEMCIVYSVT